jgi:tetratricopeptide (TPR) repeat protein
MVDPPSRKEVGEIVDVGLAAAGQAATRERIELLATKAYVIALAPKWDAAFDVAGDEAARQAVALAEETGDPDLISAAIDAVGPRLATLGLFGEIYERNRRRVELVPSLTNASEICDVYVVAAFSSLLVGRFREAVEHATRCIETASGVDEGQYINGLVWRMAATFRLGEWQHTLADYAEIERHALEVGAPVPAPLAAHAHATMLLCHRLRGDDEAARDCEDVLRALLEEGDSRRGLNAGRAILARALVHEGRLDEAEAYLGQVRGRDRIFFDEALADLHSARADWDKARALADALRGDAPRTGQRILTALADRLEGRAAAARNDLDAAAVHLRRAVAAFAELEAAWEAARERAALGVLLSDDAELERAIVELDALGATPDADAYRGRIARAAP